MSVFPLFLELMLLLSLQLCDKYQEFVTDSAREALTAKLQQVEDWLYEDGDDETKEVYVAKLEELKKVRKFQRLRPCMFSYLQLSFLF